MDNSKFKKSLDELKESLQYRKKSGAGTVADAAVSKCFEVALEYAWKALKVRIESDGLEAVSPKECVKIGASVGLISEPDRWLRFINNRNLSVHDYIGVEDENYFSDIREFYGEAVILLNKLK